MISFQRAEFGRGIGEIWLDDVLCTGTEPALLQCPADPIGQDNCGHGEDAGVRCECSVNTQIINNTYYTQSVLIYVPRLG